MEFTHLKTTVWILKSILDLDFSKSDYTWIYFEQIYSMYLTAVLDMQAVSIDLLYYCSNLRFPNHQ